MAAIHQGEKWENQRRLFSGLESRRSLALRRVGVGRNTSENKFDQGTRIQVTIFDKNIRAFEDTLTIFKKYHITNANVRPILPDHRVVNNEYQWIIDGGTTVEEIEKEDIAGTSKNTPEFSFVLFSRLDNYIDSFDQVDIIVLAIDVQPVRCIQTSFSTGSIQEVTLVNEE
ncbi:hypothetical protein LWI29_029628 [Acer saccharum]|uniref:Uncharacterized protein n=1 Tax=Acer saccharum TaxID=4024 RepID=A0AA39S017_ACESA|nr:hypothetical protein LWI29_029628 [Acer saccharum]